MDNASSPPLEEHELADLIKVAQLIAEPRPGQAYGRLTGLSQSENEVVVLVDDDNVLHPDYLLNAQSFLESHPEVGAVGGIVEAEFEAHPPMWCLQHTSLLAIRNLGEHPVISQWGETSTREYPWCAPCGAGMVIRPDCVRSYIESMRTASAFSMGRVGTKSLGGCEDCEIVLKGALESGAQVAYCPALRLVHCIPAWRVQKRYLRRLAYETGISWGEFCVRHRFISAIPRWTVPLRIAKSFLRQQGWQASGNLSWWTEAGRFVGRARRSAGTRGSEEKAQ